MICYCTLCGEEITKPYFYEGKPYGGSCIAKVSPGKNKSPRYIPIDIDLLVIKRPLVGHINKFRAI